MYLYPDMETALIGQFKNGTMIATKESRVIGEKCHRGIKEILLEKPDPQSPTFKYTPRTHINIGDQPTVMDPYERKNIYIDKGVMDDGVFAKRNMSKHDLITYYGGMIIKSTDINGPLCSRNQSLEKM